MKKIKILDTKEAIFKTAEYYHINKIKSEMFGNTYDSYEEDKEGPFYYIEGLAFHKDSCEIIEDYKIISGEPPESNAFYQLSDDKEHWTKQAYQIIGYDKGTKDSYFNGDEWFTYARKVEL